MGVIALEEVSAPVLTRIFHYIIILFPMYILMHVQSNNARTSSFIPYLTYIGSYHSSYVEVGGMWKHLVFP
jgi:hypothetical protein